MTPTLERRVAFLLLLVLFLLLETVFLVVFFLPEVRLERVVLVLLAEEALLALVVFLVDFYGVREATSKWLTFGVDFLVVFLVAFF